MGAYLLNCFLKMDYYLGRNMTKTSGLKTIAKFMNRKGNNDTLQYTKYHFGNHEKIDYANGDTKNLFYIFGGDNLTGLYIQENATAQVTFSPSSIN